MRDVLKDPKYLKDAMSPFSFREGDWVTKNSGDYTFIGMVISAFRKRSGAPRYAVENEAGLVHIFSHKQLTLHPEPVYRSVKIDSTMSGTTWVEYKK